MLSSSSLDPRFHARHCALVHYETATEPLSDR